MQTIENIKVQWRTPLWLVVAAAALMTIGLRPSPALAQFDPCSLMTGAMRGTCMQVQRAQRAAARAAPAPVPTPAPARPPAGFPTPGGAFPNANAYTQSSVPAPAAPRAAASASANVAGLVDIPPGFVPYPANGTPADRTYARGQPMRFAPQRPVLDLSVTPATLTYTVYTSTQTKPFVFRTSPNHRCGIANFGEDILPYDRACTLDKKDDRSGATALFRQACEWGDPAGCYEYAEHVSSREPAIARTFYDRGCNGGHALSCYSLAIVYETGDGAPKNPELQRTYYQRACKAGNGYGCLFIEGKIDAACPHGRHTFEANYEKKTFKAYCEDASGLSKKEIPTTPEQVAWMKSREAESKTSIPQWLIDASRGGSSTYDRIQEGQNAQDLREYNNGGCGGTCLVH
jgi:hypothetical protein